MTLGEAVMEALSAWDEFRADTEGYDGLAEAMERLREKASAALDAELRPYTPSMGDPYPIEKLRAMQAQEAELEAKIARGGSE